jgi:hypothetical protein
MGNSRFTIEQAKRAAAQIDLIARVSAEGGMLLIYEGEEEFPGTWMEVDRLRITDGSVPAWPAYRDALDQPTNVEPFGDLEE